MKIAFISDIHGHKTALDAVLHDIERLGCDKTYALGDICYRGPEPSACLETVRRAADGMLKGNADAWVVRGVRSGEVPDDKLDIMAQECAWTQGHLSKGEIQYLDSLPMTIEDLDADVPWQAFHATPTNLFTAIAPDAIDETITTQLLATQRAQLLLYGHIHVPYVRTVESRTIVNLGSVGLPFDNIAEASYAVVEMNRGEFTVNIRRVGYDIEAAVRALHQNDYPNASYVEQVIRTAHP